MCGLAGLVCRRALSNEDHAARVRRMCGRIAHRGPDDSGIELRDGVCLGSQRLAILDLSPAGHMPMLDPSGRYALAYNGEVYNYRELRRELEALGHVFASQGDTEVVLRAWMSWGASMLPRLAGIFAFALHDQATGEVALVRDHYGIKPLYYLDLGAEVLFASEIKALLDEHPGLRVDRKSLTEWSLYRNIDTPSPETLIEGILSVLPGELVTIGAGGVERRYFYRPTDVVDRARCEAFAAMTPEGIVAQFERQLDAIIAEQLVSDVPVGTFLSGGLDSSLVTTLAARHRPDLKAFHVSVDGFPAHDERPFAEEVCKRSGIEFVPLALDGSAYRGALVEATWLSDSPLEHPNSVAYRLVSQLARDHGVIVALAGEGADELFGGYSWAYRRERRVARLMPWLRRIPSGLRAQLALLLYADLGMPALSHRFRDLLPPTVDLIDGYARSAWRRECEGAYGFLAKPIDRSLAGAMLSDLSDFLTPLLRRLDRMSMGASVEARVPFLDPRLVREAVNLPIEFRVGGRADKWIVKEIARRHLPEHLVSRTKMGFPLPLESFIEPFAHAEFFKDGFVAGTLGVSTDGLDKLLGDWRSWTYGLFGLVGLEIWGRMFLMGEQVDAVRERLDRFERNARAA